MTFWLPLLILLAVMLVCWIRERQPKQPDPSFRPWHIRLLPRQKKK